ncbi:MAG: TIGR02186 family protein [Alphaproteobacteria bacterium]|nr:TIGR02186 family protein [Alphaproteobacteria bacterium]
MNRARLPFLAALTLLWLGAFPVRAEPLVADLSDHLIEITTGFTGAEVLLFGATEGAGDIVVIVRGPAQNLIVRQKESVAGIWMNRNRMHFKDVPAYYTAASNRPIAEIVPHEMRVRNEIGAENLRLATTTESTKEAADLFRKALIRRKQTQQLYGMAPGEIAFMSNSLFQTRLYFPATVPVGIYTVKVLLVREKQVVSVQTTPLIVQKTGVEAAIFNFAHAHAAQYGIVAIFLALVAGWLAGVFFRRV